MRFSELDRYHVVETPSRLVDIPPETSPAIDRVTAERGNSVPGGVLRVSVSREVSII